MKLKYLLDTDVFSLMVKGQDAAINTRLQSLAKGEGILSVSHYRWGVLLRRSPRSSFRPA